MTIGSSPHRELRGDPDDRGRLILHAPLMDCHLHRFLGDQQPCAGETCPYWQVSGCVIVRVAVGPDDRRVAAYLLDVRDRLERLRVEEDRRRPMTARVRSGA